MSRLKGTLRSHLLLVLNNQPAAGETVRCSACASVPPVSSFRIGSSGHPTGPPGSAYCHQHNVEIGAHVCAAINNFLVIEFHARDVEWRKDLVDGAPPIVDGFIEMGDSPGHVLTLNEDTARKHLKKGSSFFGDFTYEC